MHAAHRARAAGRGAARGRGRAAAGQRCAAADAAHARPTGLGDCRHDGRPGRAAGRSGCPWHPPPPAREAAGRQWAESGARQGAGRAALRVVPGRRCADDERRRRPVRIQVRRGGGGAPATGVPRPLSAVLRQRVSILDFGGSNDGTTDCTNAIQQAINVARSRPGGVDIFFPAGCYLVTKTLRVTDLAGGGVSFTGEGTGIPEFAQAPSRGSDLAVQAGAGSCIIGRTGGVVFDCAGSQFLTFRRLVIQSNDKDQGYSTCGLLFARTKASEFVQFNKIEDVVVDLASDPSANGGKGTVACYMIAAELTTLRNVYLLADTALANIVSNEWGITSSWTTIDTMYISNSCITLDGICTLAAKHPVGQCWRANMAINVTMHNIYLQAMTTKQGRAPGLVISGGYKISFSGHVEGPTPVILAKKGSVSDCEFHWTGGRTQPDPLSNPSGSPVHVGADDKDFMIISRWMLHIVEFDLTWKQVIEFKDRGGVLENLRLRLGKDDLAGKTPTPAHPGGPDDGSVPASNSFNEVAICREIGGDAGKKRYGGLCTGLSHSRVSDALLFLDAQEASGMGAGSLYLDKSSGKLSFVDATKKVHALY